MEIVLVAVCGVMCGAESWSEIEELGQAKESWLRQYLEWPGGIASHDTFSRVLRLLDAGSSAVEKTGQRLRRVHLNWITAAISIQHICDACNCEV